MPTAGRKLIDSIGTTICQLSFITMGYFIKNFLEPFSYLIYAIALFFEYRRDKTVKKKVLFIFYLISVILIGYACKVALDITDNNNWIYNSHYILSAAIFEFYFYNILVSNKTKKIVLVLYTATIIVLVGTSVFTKNSFFNSYGSAFFFIVMVTSSLIYLRQRFRQLNEENILLTFDLWLISGYVLYFLGSFFIVLTYNYYSTRLSEEKWYLLADIWGVQNVLLFISSLLAMIGHLWVSYRKTSR
jgi:hypothetical membrane protein